MIFFFVKAPLSRPFFVFAELSRRMKNLKNSACPECHNHPRKNQSRKNCRYRKCKPQIEKHCEKRSGPRTCSRNRNSDKQCKTGRSVFLNAFRLFRKSPLISRDRSSKKFRPSQCLKKSSSEKNDKRNRKQIAGKADRENLCPWKPECQTDNNTAAKLQERDHRDYENQKRRTQSEAFQKFYHTLFYPCLIFLLFWRPISKLYTGQ